MMNCPVSGWWSRASQIMTGCEITDLSIAFGILLLVWVLVYLPLIIWFERWERRKSMNGGRS